MNLSDPSQPSTLLSENRHSLALHCASALTNNPSKPAIEFERQWLHWEDIQRVASKLNALVEANCVKPGDTIAFVPRNRPSAIAALLGLISRQHSIQMIYAFQSPAVIASDIEKLNPRLIIAAKEDFTAPVLSVLRNQHSAGIALSEMDAISVVGFEDKPRNSPATIIDPHIGILTSGTTGAPKRFQISYDMIAKLVGNNADNQQPVAIYFPLGNISGIFSTIPVMLKGQPVILLERFTIPGWRDFVVRYQPEFSSLPPAGIAMVLEADIPPSDLASLRYLASGAAPLDPTLQRKFEQRYGIPVLLSYGATEFGGPVTAMTPELHAIWGDSKLGSAGQALPGVQLRVMDTETGVEMPSGQQGILDVVSPRVGPQWIRTSDLAMIDEDGFLFHCGRQDSAIMRGGFKILPDVIERALMTHPAIAAAAAIGIPDARLGQAPAIAIELKTSFSIPSQDELEEHLRAQLPSTHIPVFWKFAPALPRTPSMKVERAGLLKLFAPD